jgi:protein-disulfide isomerase
MTGRGTHRRALLAAGAGAVLGLATGPAAARAFRVPVELASRALELPGRITLGDRDGDVTLVEFFDYNCSFCRQSAADIRPLLAGDRSLRYVLVNYAVLGEASVEAARVALGFSMQKTPGGYFALHERLFRLRGRVDALRALGEAVALGADRDRLIRDADSRAVTDALVRSVDLGENLGLVATPAFLAGNEAVVGYVDLAAKRRAIRNLRKCEQTDC